MFGKNQINELSTENAILRRKIEELNSEMEKLSGEKNKLSKAYDLLTAQEIKGLETANERLEGVDKLDLDDNQRSIYISGIKSERHYEEYKGYIKKVVDAIVDLERERSGMNFDNLDVCVVTIYEYLENVFKNKKFKLQNGNTYAADKYEYFRAFTNIGNHDIIIILQNDEYNRIIDVIIATFHELQHYEDREILLNANSSKDRNSLAAYLDSQIFEYDESYYESSHDLNMFEIHANERSTIKAQDFLRRNKLIYGVSDEDREYLSILGKIYEFNTYLYDYYEAFDRFIKIYRKNADKIILPSFLQMFLNNDGSFKDVESIVSNKVLFEYNSDYNGMVAMVLCSNAFRKEVFDFKNFSNSQLSDVESKLADLVFEALSIKNIDERNLWQKLTYELDSLEYNVNKITYAENKKLYYQMMDEIIKEFRKKRPNTSINFDEFYTEMEKEEKHL